VGCLRQTAENNIPDIFRPVLFKIIMTAKSNNNVLELGLLLLEAFLDFVYSLRTVTVTQILHTISMPAVFPP